MKSKNIIILFVTLVIIGAVVIFVGFKKEKDNLDPTPKNVVLSGVYVCLPHKDTKDPQTEECVFGIKTDKGDYYAVNFGQSADSMNQFQSGFRIKAEGFTVIKEALNTNQWDKYNMKGIFTVTKMISSSPVIQGKLNINVVCEQSLIYMTFENSKKADEFIAECKEGKHPDVIEKYKERMGLGDGVAI